LLLKSSPPAFLKKKTLFLFLLLACFLTQLFNTIQFSLSPLSRELYPRVEVSFVLVILEISVIEDLKKNGKPQGILRS